VSEHLRHQQRLEVLNRVLRHNIRNETNVIYGYADLLADAEGGGESAEIVKDRAMTIADMGEKARQIVEVFEHVHAESTPVPLAELVAESVADTRGRFPGVGIEVGPIPDDAYVDELVEPALSNLVENAAEHNTGPDPTVEVRASVEGDRVRVVVADDGPGIDAYERSVLERGTETPLEHGSGLGLWLVTWAVGIVGGEVTIRTNDPSGSVVTVEVPRLDPDRDVADGASEDDATGTGTGTGTGGGGGRGATGGTEECDRVISSGD
jgi:signal transduction histidine kinase